MLCCNCGKAITLSEPMYSEKPCVKCQRWVFIDCFTCYNLDTGKYEYYGNH